MRTRGENWKLRVPLLAPVDKDEVREVADRYGLVAAIAELKEQKEAAEGTPVTVPDESDSGDAQDAEKGTFGEEALAAAAVAGNEENALAGGGAGSDAAHEGKETEEDASLEGEMVATMDIGAALTGQEETSHV